MTVVAAGVAALLVTLVVGFAARQYWRDPVAALPQSDGPATMVAERPGSPALQQPGGGERRVVRHYTLEHATLGSIGFVVSLPEPIPDRPIPLVLVLGGLGTGEKNIKYVSAPGDNAIIGYDWPIPRKLPKGLELAGELPDLYGRALKAPGQAVAMIDWLSGQPWADSERISILGFSLGALAAPAIQRLATAAGHDVGWTVLAYGGADLGHLLVSHPDVQAGWVEPLLAGLANLLFRPIEPAEHLPHLSGRFLVLAGSDDSLIPEHSSELMRELTPTSKTEILLDGEHMGIGDDKRALLDEIVGISRLWLIDHGAVNPP